MILQIVPLTHEHLKQSWSISDVMEQAYFTDGSVSYCMLRDGEPVLAGGIVNLQWLRGEAWLLTTPFYYKHVKTCLKSIRLAIPSMASLGTFKRVQAVCATSSSVTLFKHLGFHYEGVLNHFGPNGETCFMYARIFD